MCNIDWDRGVGSWAMVAVSLMTKKTLHTCAQRNTLIASIIFSQTVVCLSTVYVCPSPLLFGCWFGSPIFTFINLFFR